MEKKVFQIRCAIKDKESKKVKTRRIYCVMAKDLADAKSMLQEKWFVFEIEVLDVLNEWALEEYIVLQYHCDGYGELLYRAEEL